jgi:hypothetical protein
MSSGRKRQIISPRADGMRHAITLICAGFMAFAAVTPAAAQVGYDRRGGDYTSFPVRTGDPAVCAARCEHDGRCRAWSFSFPRTLSPLAACRLKSKVPPREEDACCVSGVRGAGVIEPRVEGVETSIDRPGGDLRNFELKESEGEEACKAACTADNKCRAFTYARPGYTGREARCFLKKDIKPPRRKAGFKSGVVR